AENIIETREEEGRFESLYDFAHKVDLRSVNRKVFESLMKCGAFDSTDIFRSQGMAVLDQVLAMAAKAHRDRDAGQMSFFDEDSAGSGFQKEFRELPDIPEWPEHELLANEKEMLGFYITQHPLARFERLLNAYSTCRISSLADMADGQEVLIGGIMNKARITVTRKKAEKMAIASLEDLDSFVELLVFPRAYRKCPELVKVDSLIYVKGRLSLREEEPKIIAEDIIPLEAVKERFTKAVLVKILTTGVDESQLVRVKLLLSKHKGNIPVFLELISPEGRKIRMAVDKEMGVSPSDELISDVEALIGSGNIKFLTR
ncbi:MAG: hypothetical protein GF392_03765, partial [Candidatus Omnitrophica bacterium]|nr:hypothetical protein [Candidatus Omnitrophota bacterium]